MGIRTKILLLFTLGTTVPFLLGNLFVVFAFSRMTEQRIGRELVHTARLASSRVGDRLERTLEDLEAVSLGVPFRELMLDDLRRAQELPYRQMPRATLVAIIDGSGKAVVPPFQPSPELAASLSRQAPSPSDLEKLALHVPLRLALSASAAIGPVYRGSGGDPRLVVAKELRRREEGDRPWVLAVEISLSKLCTMSAEYGTHAATVRLVDTGGATICGGPPAQRDIPQSVLAQLSRKPLVDWFYPDGLEVMSTAADVTGSAWRLVIEQSKAELRRPIVEAYKITAVWLAVSLAMAVIGGLILSREFTVPIAGLEAAAQRLATGDYSTKIGLNSSDELGRLSQAFDKMAQEIEAWNKELVERVEQRTAALREAHEQMLRTQKLAAIGELGSGAAHEINNPLTVVIGTAQLLESAAPPQTELAKGLLAISTNARRVADIVNTLLRISQSQVHEHMRPVDMSQIVNRVIDLHATRFEEQHIQVDTDFEPPSMCRVHGIGPDLELALSQVVDNALRALPNRGVIGFSVSTMEGGAVQVVVSDNGPGMSEDVRLRAFDPFFTTNSPSSGSPGLGLSLVQRIVQEHSGRIVLESEPGKGTRIKIYLPGAARLSRS
ncbi:MAG: HAMP domain-containing histidine kinase [Myxococcota bacterium]|jgi:signal transduction histidine kinase|nr:HAMP domain-containing histidine kinase [Myxococcota bacterium]